MVNTRSMGRRVMALESRAEICPARRPRACFNSSSPVRLRELTGMIGAFSRNEPHNFERFGVDQVGLRQDDNSMLDSEQTANIEVLAGLRLDPFVGGDDEQN